MKRPLAAFAFATLAIGTTWASSGRDPLDRAIRDALSADDATRERGIEVLRERGPAGLDALFEARLDRDDLAPDDRWEVAIDGVAGQKDASWSELFWHMDLDTALDEAERTGKPVLSLRMLGDLRDARSCANSRFFRAVLYADPDVAERMREDFVLHWSSERAVPRITIDFGDGRSIHSTITGNSAHYVLDAQGRPLDVIPGLHAAEAFLVALADAGELHDRVVANPERREDLLVAWHTEARDRALERLQFTKMSGLIASSVLDRDTTGDASVPAVRAIPLAVGKGVWEQPVAEAFVPGSARVPGLTPDDLVIWGTATLHPDALERIRSQRPAGPGSDDAAFDALITRFTSELMRDTTWNRDVLHTRVHDRFARRETGDFETLNAWVYAGLFKTPAGDPWLGLWSPDIYTGLVDGGLVVPSR
jgi:hypothetical protein